MDIRLHVYKRKEKKHDRNRDRNLYPWSKSGLLFGDTMHCKVSDLHQDFPHCSYDNMKEVVLQSKMYPYITVITLPRW